MALETLSAQTTRAATSTPMREAFIAPKMLPICCVCGLIRDETGSFPDRERWVRPRTYQTTHGLNPTEFLSRILLSEVFHTGHGYSEAVKRPSRKPSPSRSRLYFCHWSPLPKEVPSWLTHIPPSIAPRTSRSKLLGEMSLAGKTCRVIQSQDLSHTSRRRQNDAAVPKHQTLFTQGDAATAVFYILEGRVKLTVISLQGKEAVVAMLGVGIFSVKPASPGSRHAWRLPPPWTPPRSCASTRPP